MSLIFRYPCPRCGRPTELTDSSVCRHQVNEGVCGYEFPTELLEFNGRVREKIGKHTKKPSGAFTGKISYNPSTGFYLENLLEARAAGDIYLDRANGYFCTYVTPSGDAAIATCCSGNANNQFNVSGFKMPLNSRIQNIHGHYDNLHEDMLYVATPFDTVVEYPSPQHPDEFRVLQSGNVVAAWNTAACSGFVGDHIVIK